MRLIQEYFLVSAGVQSIVRHYVKAGMNIREFDKKIAIHINDTHPALCVAELMRILVDDYNLEWNEAWTITRGTCAYTNHTILPEALETWNVDLFKTLLPRIYMIIDEINRRHVEYIRARYPDKLKKRPRINEVSFFWRYTKCFYERSILVRVHSTIVAEEIVSNAPLFLSPTNACVTFNSDAAVKMFSDVKLLRGFGIVVNRVSPSVNL